MLLPVCKSQITGDNIGVEKISGGALELLGAYDFLNRIRDCRKLYALVFPILRPRLTGNIQEYIKTAERHRPHFRDLRLFRGALKLNQLNCDKRVFLNPLEIFEACAPKLFWVFKYRSAAKT